MIENVTNERGDCNTCEYTLFWGCVRFGEVYRGVESDDSFDTLWAQSRCCYEGNVTTRRKAAEEDVGWVILPGVRSDIMDGIFCVLCGCGERVFWSFAIISIEDYTLRASGDNRTEFVICAEKW
jgi:hypothetical protein